MSYLIAETLLVSTMIHNLLTSFLLEYDTYGQTKIEVLWGFLTLKSSLNNNF